jgi:hypothetical protein
MGIEDRALNLAWIEGRVSLVRLPQGGNKEGESQMFQHCRN